MLKCGSSFKNPKERKQLLGYDQNCKTAQIELCLVATARTNDRRGSSTNRTIYTTL
jgi:hypothetical protein